MSIFGKRPIKNELEPPPMASENPQSLEFLRMWTVKGGPMQLVLKTTWEDPAVWGIALVDIARHAANAYANDGYDHDEALQRIKYIFDAEWAKPTSPAEDLTPK